ncbi:MAG TPA: bifunctional (p)ppGpp synthetase/guanosine-3',5'-bis(diphosphate) 3'-pyrophosphohydrolase [Bacteroidia bacterium]|nr:bifunctional (p)ppGpp synthetase/guanosine-3',5'-bis(diphosphate) 3'-pyrophosphohydrolase [Bacteroidia bacterium]
MEAAAPTTPIINLEQEKKEILNRYRGLLRSSRRKFDDDDKKMIRKAFNVAVEAHKDARRKSGEPYIYHPIAVARIVAEEIGLGATAIACALLHDVVEDTDITLKDIEGMFGKKVASIIDGLTKISGVFDASSSLQAENFRKMLLTLADDVRVILIKLADRLHNMRTLESMERTKQLKIASETLYLYAPLAHRLGLNNIKTELEDLGLKYTEPEIYNDLDKKLKDTQAERARYIHRFIIPLREALHEQKIKFRIFGRPKSIYSIWSKIKNKNVPFEEVYDIFAIRILIDSPPEQEKADCWRVYSIVTDFYYPNPDRLRDWVSTPKANGYEALHTTVMGPNGQWVEVQVRSERMNEVAEKGYAAHWKYKQGSTDHPEDPLEEWLRKIRESLSNPDSNALDFIDDFKLNLFADEIFVFTPKGEMRSMPVNSTALDFAFDVHSEIGTKCIGAKVNHKLVPLSHKLNSGDQVEILTSNKQTPKLDWMNFVVTAKAKSRIKEFLKEEKTKLVDKGREELRAKMHQHKLEFNEPTLKRFAAFLKLPDSSELFYRMAMGTLTNKEIKDFVKVKDKPIEPQVPAQTLEQLVSNKRGKSDFLVIGDNLDNLEYKLSPCCNPIPGDDVFGFITIHEGIKIHRVNCPNAIELMSNYAYRIVKAKWTSQKLISFLAGIKVIGIDKMGLVNGITQVISNELNVNMRYISFDTNDGTFEGNIMVFVHDTAHLTSLMKKLEKVDGVIKVTRVDTNQ